MTPATLSETLYLREAIAEWELGHDELPTILDTLAGGGETFEDILNDIKDGIEDWDAFKERVSGLNKAERYVLRKVGINNGVLEAPLGHYFTDYSVAKQMQKWFRHSLNSNQQQLLVELEMAENTDRGAFLDTDLCLYLNLRISEDVWAFAQVYEGIRVEGRVWNSSYQPDQLFLANIVVKHPTLPSWVQAQLCKYAPAHAKIDGDRPGDSWRLIPCVKAWKWCKDLPKAIAERVGAMSLQARMLAPIAWHNATHFPCRFSEGKMEVNWELTRYIQNEEIIQTDNFFYRYDDDFSVNPVLRQFCETAKSMEKGTELTLSIAYSINIKYCYTPTIEREDIFRRFWMELRRLLKLSPAQKVQEIYSWASETREHDWRIRVAIETILGLPYNFLKEDWGRDNKLPNQVHLTEMLATYGSPAIACETLFGTTGRKTVELFSQSNKTAWQWAHAIAERNPDYVQKILALKEGECINFEPEAIPFLMSLKLSARLRLLQKTEFRYRGEDHPITNDHVRDTGYLYQQLAEGNLEMPTLGRVRCWFSVHETLAAAYVAQLPDEALPVHPNWERVDGLCSVDGEWSIELPRRVATLQYWGSKSVFSNCVGGYGNAIKSGRSIIFGVRWEGSLRYCVEIEDSGHLSQFYGKGNSSPNYNHRDAVLGALSQAGLVRY